MKQICIIGTGYVGLVTGACFADLGNTVVCLDIEWNEFKQLDKSRLRSLMRQPYLIDGRNIYDREEMERLGFVYWGLGRGMAGASAAPRAEPEGAQP